MKISRYQSASLLLIILLLNSVFTFSQSLPPPSSGSGPGNGSDNSKILLPVAGGLVVGAAVYYLIRKKGKGTPTSIHMNDYLWRHNILPTADAIKIMNALNPGISETGIGRKQKLNMPDLPDMPTMVQPSASADPLPILNEQFVLLKSNLNNHRKKYSTNVSLSKLNNDLNTAEKDVAVYRGKPNEMDPQKTELVTDLVRVLNQTLKSAARSDKLKETDFRLMEDICQNLSEILRPQTSKAGKPTGQLRPESDPSKTFYASLDPIYLHTEKNSSNNLTYPGLKPNNRLPDDVSKIFAVAICKIKQDGTMLTKGPDLEKKYTIRYVCPALKEYRNSYHSFSEPATWAWGKLYPAKYYFEVYAGTKRLSLQEPLIDILDRYKGVKPGRPNDPIKILINIYE